MTIYCHLQVVLGMGLREDTCDVSPPSQTSYRELTPGTNKRGHAVRATDGGCDG